MFLYGRDRDPSAWREGFEAGAAAQDRAINTWLTPEFFAVPNYYMGYADMVCRCYGSVASYRVSLLQADWMREGTLIELLNRLEFQCWRKYRHARQGGA